MPFGATSRGLYMPTPGGRITPTPDTIHVLERQRSCFMAATCRTALHIGLPMNKSLVVIALLAPFGASAAKLPCSIHPKASIADADLPALAKVTHADAQITALKAVDVASASVSSSDLESEGGCLIYAFDIKLAGQDLDCRGRHRCPYGQVVAEDVGRAEGASCRSGTRPRSGKGEKVVFPT